MRKSKTKELEERLAKLEQELMEMRKPQINQIGYIDFPIESLPAENQPYWCIYPPTTTQYPEWSTTTGSPRYWTIGYHALTTDYPLIHPATEA